jgi:UDP-4-amino-4,6-dideoxy-N-acetyl-beta-L-altrosamine transaminase
MIPYGRQEITREDVNAVVEVLKSDYLTQGPVVPIFEQSVCDYTGGKFGVATNSATSALHIACLALGLGEDDYLWTVPITFVSSANCGLYCGAKIDFVDIDPETYNISIHALENKLIEAEMRDQLPKIVIPVHFAGQSCDMGVIYKLSQKYGFKIIEDASHAIGGKYKGKPVGDCQYSNIVIFSFHPVKIITTGEGGIAVTNSQQLAEKMSLLRSHGITRDKDLINKEPDGPWYYQQIDLGFNYRMTDIHAALGISQMKRLDQYVTKRHEVAERYNNALEGQLISNQRSHTDVFSSCHLYVIRLNKSAPISHKILFEQLRDRGVGVNLHYIPVHMQPYYQKIGFNVGDYPNAEQYYQEAISLPIFPALSEADQNYVISSIQESIY